VSGLRDSSTRRSWAVLGGLLVLALALRLLVLPVPGHGGDVAVMSRWAENLATWGPLLFYQHDTAIYPALLPFLWPIGLALDGDGLRYAIKGISIPFDLLLGVLLYAVVAHRTDQARGLLAGGLYLLNPAAIIGGPLWGQVDAAGTLFYLAALAGCQFAGSGSLTALAGLSKPQFGLVALPLAVVTLQRWRQGHGPRPLVLAVVGGGLTALIVCLAFGLSPFRWLELLQDAAARHPETSLGAFNIWALLVGFEVPDEPYVGIGGVLLVAGIIGSLIPLRRGSDLATLLAVGLFLAFAFYFLPTRVHERYLFPALALAAPFAAVDRSSLAAYLAMSVGFALSLLRVLVETTSFRTYVELDALLTSDIMVWVIGLTLIGSALTLIRLTLSGAGDPLNERDAPPAAEPAADPDAASAAPG
jgi:dolichyl-phosphate-mannose-protein mannosyltransferase